MHVLHDMPSAGRRRAAYNVFPRTGIVFPRTGIVFPRTGIVFLSLEFAIECIIITTSMELVFPVMESLSLDRYHLDFLMTLKKMLTDITTMTVSKL